MKKQAFIFLILSIMVFTGIFSLYAAEELNPAIDFSIRYYDRSIYYTDSPIYIKVEITNNSMKTYRFKLADLRPFSIDFSLKTLQHREIEHSDRFIMERNTNRQIFFREISLEPGEAYSFIEDLSDFIDITESRQYRLQAQFYPELVSSGSPFYSNTLSLSVRPSTSTDPVMDRIEEETGAILRAEALSPDQVVSYVINARQRSQWEKFFLYLDLQSLYLRNPGNEAKYRRGSEADRRFQIEEYRQSLQAETIDQDLLVIPHEFRILKTTYTENEGTVDVLVKIKYSDFTELKQYTYQLQKSMGIWYIDNYEVRNLGTE
ncbi:MAG: hypothetical protein JEY99_00730 [Spirochaetales bacterium]|nr:hypothetical protein [Spirochaetales bacterium]